MAPNAPKTPKRPAAPKTLRAAGKALWLAVWADLPGDWILDRREQAILAMAARQADELALLEDAIDQAGVIVAGAAGQSRLSAAVTEARQARLAIGRLLGQLSLPDEDEQPLTQAGQRARHAATARWNRRAAVAERRAG